MNLSILDRSFPLPKYLHLETVGIDISDRSIKMIRMKQKKEGLRPVMFADEKVPMGVIEKGTLNDAEKLTKIFKKIKKEYRVDHAVVSLPEEKAYVFTTLLPRAVKDIRGAIELQIEDNVPLPASHVVFDFEIVRENKKGQIVVNVSVLARQVVLSYLEVLKAAGILVLAFEIEAHSLARAVVPIGTKETIMIVDFGQTRSGFTIVSDGRVRFSSTSNIGGDNVVRAIAQKFEVSEEIARKMKEERGLLKTKDQELFFVLTPVVSLIRDEINKFQLFWDTRKSEIGAIRPNIKKILLCGGDANIPGLIEHISSGLETPFALANPWVNVFSLDDYIPDIDKKQALRYVSAIGLSLRRFKQFM